MAQPLFKWPGGKRWLVPQLREMYGSRHTRLLEPFAGGAALFFHLEPAQAVLGDINPEISTCYQAVRDNLPTVVSVLESFENSKGDYYRIRAWEPRTIEEKAARFLYLTRLSFNGIYRENLEGKFNVPYGNKVHLSPFDPDLLRSSSQLLQFADIRSGDFEATLSDATSGDFVYIDPPYTVAHNDNGFVKYNAKVFSWEDQIRLSETAMTLVSRGCTVVVSNADHYSLRRLYQGFEYRAVRRFSRVGSKAAYRQEVSEALFMGGMKGTGTW